MFGFEFVIGGTIFWFLLIGLIILCEISTVAENHWSSLWLGIFLGLLALDSNVNPFSWMWHNPLTFLSYATIYFVIGALWGFVKWWFYLKNERDRIDRNVDSLRASWQQEGSKKTFTEWLQRNGYISAASKNKDRISIWMFWWPFSMFWSTFNDVIRRIYNWFITQYISIFDKINKAVFGSLE